MTQQQHNIEQQVRIQLDLLRESYCEPVQERAIWALARAYNFPTIHCRGEWVGGSPEAWYDLVFRSDDLESLLRALCDYADYIEEVRK